MTPESALAGLSLPSPAYLFGTLLFGLIGMAAFGYGRKTDRPRTLCLGLVLMLYPYAVSGTGLLYAIGTLLCAGLWLDREG